MSQRVLLCREAPAGAADSGANTVTNKLLCDEECLASLESIQTQETKTGLKYKDIVVGKGPSPPTGYQVLQHCPNLRFRPLQALCADTSSSVLLPRYSLMSCAGRCVALESTVPFTEPS